MTTLERYVVGVDGGGTRTRCLVATTNGRAVGRGRAAGVNPNSVRDPGASLLAALQEALEGVPRERVVGGVFGLAGAGAAGEAGAVELATRAWSAAGVSGFPAVVPDMLVAYSAGTTEPAGTVLVAGTGAVAARIQDRAIARRCDGYGWIVGDEGSAVWIGRRGMSAALAALDGRGAPTALVDALVNAVPQRSSAAGNEARAQALVAAVYGREPAWLGTMSPIVEATARAGDEVALAIVHEASSLLLRTVHAVAVDGADNGPVVLAGGLLTAPTMVSELVHKGLRGATVATATDGAAGAAALALYAAAPQADPAALQDAHLRLVTAGGAGTAGEAGATG